MLGAMPVLRERKRWRRVRVRGPSDVVTLDYLSTIEETNVRAALRVMRDRYGAWAPVAKALRMHLKSLERIVSGRDRRVPAALSLRVAKTLGVPVEDVLQGKWPGPGACPRCGRS